MLKKILSNWHYGIKASVIDGALLVKFDTAIEPALLRLDLARVQANTMSVRTIEGDYELGLAGYKMDFVPLARFESRDAAEAAQRSIECALFSGAKPQRFRNALVTTFGVGVGIVVVLFIAMMAMGGALGTVAGDLMHMPAMSTPVPTAANAGIDPATLQALQAMQGMSGTQGGLPEGFSGLPSAAATEPGVPMSADDFLKQTGGGK